MNHLDFLDSRAIRASVIGVFAILALFLLSQTLATASHIGRTGTPATDTITVQGDGQATMAPDVARVSFSVEHTAATVADAQSKTTEQANAAIAYVKQQGIAEKDIKTMYYNISPQYSYPNPCPPGSMCPAYTGTPKITGYQVSETIQVTVRDLAKVGDLIGELGKLEVQNLNGPSFALDDPTSGYAEARADAIAKAKQQAELLANQLGVHLGKIVNFSESSNTYYRYATDYAVGKGGMEASAPAPQLPTGENTYNATVSITYEIR